jgi:hypothetical protein
MPGKRAGSGAASGSAGRAAARRRPQAGETPDLFTELEQTGQAGEGRKPSRESAPARSAGKGSTKEGSVSQTRGKAPDDSRTAPSAGNPFDPWGAFMADQEEGVPAPPKPGGAKKKPATRR